MSDSCTHDWQPFWDGSLGYTATDRCGICGDYRPTPEADEPLDPPRLIPSWVFTVPAEQPWETTLGPDDLDPGED